MAVNYNNLDHGAGDGADMPDDGAGMAGKGAGMAEGSASPADIAEIRKKIDQIDTEIIRAIAGRQQIVADILDGKVKGGKAIRDEAREELILEEIRKKAVEHGTDPYFLEKLFRDIIRFSVRYQVNALVDHQNRQAEKSTIRVAYQGTDGAFSHQAAIRHFQDRYDRVECLGYTRFHEATQAVDAGDADTAILPIENTTAGSINDTYDLLEKHDLFITGEEVLHINHCLMAVQNVPLEHIRRIISHPQAIAQCSEFLSREDWHVETYFDTAMAARKVRGDQDLSQAAIASSYAAEVYGLEILQRNVMNQEKNYTRFVVVSPRPIVCDPQLPCKTSLIFSTTDQKGALLDCLNVLGEVGINMTKLESRPRIGHPFQSLFYLDFEGNRDDARVSDALHRLEAKTKYLKILGSYPVVESEW
ncbi:MAG: prephenate dehydratase [Bacteroidetes bacterium]|nr:MAG: prephenate dehydratase [Bacteroidota bacterium]